MKQLGEKSRLIQMKSKLLKEDIRHGFASIWSTISIGSMEPALICDWLELKDFVLGGMCNFCTSSSTPYIRKDIKDYRKNVMLRTQARNSLSKHLLKEIFC